MAKVITFINMKGGVGKTTKTLEDMCRDSYEFMLKEISK